MNSDVFLEQLQVLTLQLEVCKTIRFDFRSDIGLRRMSNIRHPKRPSSDVRFSTFDQPSVECRISDIRSALLRISDFRHSIGRPSNVEYSTSEAPFFECRIFDISYILIFYRNFVLIFEFIALKRAPICGRNVCLAFFFEYFSI